MGDFDGDKIETIGLLRESTGLVYFRNSHTQGVADNEFIYGDPGDRLVAGDWNDNGIDSPALFRPSNTTWYFRYSNTQGVADETTVWGESRWLPVAGMFGPLVPDPTTTTTTSTTVVKPPKYGLLLGAEGCALVVWGTLSRVRRRAMLGLAAITAAVLLAVMIPLIQGANQNLTGGWWLVIGGAAAVVFITAGSLIEKYRTRVGDRLAEWGEILESWE